MNRVGGEMPIGAGGHAVAERLDELDVVTLEAELDARARERVGLRSLALDPRFAQQQPESRDLVELHRVTPCREVAAIDRHGSPAPHAIVAFEAYPIRDDDVRLGGIGAAAVVDRRAARGVQLERVPYALQRPVIGQVGAAQHRAAVAVHGDHVLMRVEPLLTQEIRRGRRIQRHRRVSDVYRVLLPDHVEAAEAGVPGDAVRLQGAAGAPAVREHAAAREDVRLSLAHLYLLRRATDRVDFYRAGPSPGRVCGRSGLLDEGDEEHGGHHWFGRVNFPPVPLGRTAVTTLKSGSDVNPSPSMWRVGSSNMKARSELT